jgi:hypothetical protein
MTDESHSKVMLADLLAYIMKNESCEFFLTAGKNARDV